MNQELIIAAMGVIGAFLVLRVFAKTIKVAIKLAVAAGILIYLGII